MSLRILTRPVILAVVVLMASWPATGLGQVGGYVVKITDPERDGLERGRGMNVKGTASIPSGDHLWVLAHRIDFEGVWVPQGEGKIDPRSHEWQVSVTFGETQDIGWDFEIAVVTVKEDQHILLQNYRRKAMMEGTWRPIEMPPTTSAPQIRKVKKISHN
jgi:hypothetical protein